jgi:hypothetical protein
MANIFFRLFTSIFKFPYSNLIWNNSVAFCAYITFVATSSTNFGVFIYVVGFLDPYADDPIFYTNLLPNSNSNGNPFTDLGLLPSIYIFNGLNIVKEGCVSILSICSLVACKPSCVVVANDVVNDGNVVDLQWFPSNFHIHHHQSANVLHPLKTLCHVPS